MALLKKIISILTSTLLIVVIAITGFLLVGKMNDGKTMLFGNQLMVVLSGSMSPTFDTGSIVAVGPVDFKEVQTNDIITFKDPEGRTITHRVVEIKDDQLITKGDANDGKDTSPVTSDRFIGKVQYSIPYIGFFIEFAKSGTGMLFLLGIPGVYLIVSQVWKLLKMIKNEDSNTATKSQA
ncbi:signal peptidase I [Brevibacillus choshinensis]|uniref:Signal peptidase I n=1 Tax=Brevibacillus choshinensis TaxID=54911 RepID=A0ABX7FR56_BRECH|nr:signal peptidase I [Brevibacillus choshinensis]QRG68112.1 signal peptidase I [Brevibacillus choshinensis]